MSEIRPNPPLAAALIVLATAFIAATSLIAKALGTDTLGPPLSALQISQGRFVFAFLAFSSATAILRPRFTKPAWRWHIGRTASGWAGVTLMFAAVAFIPMGDATAISFLNPVIAMVLAIPILGERVGPIRWIAAGIALIGTLILLRPTPDSFQPAALIALAAACAMGVELVFIKRLSRRESPIQILIINNGLGLVISSVAAAFVWQMPTPQQWGALVAIGLIMACAQTAYVNGMARADASFATPFAYTTLVFATLYDGLIFGERPDAVSLTGAAVIVGGAALLAWREGRKTPVTPSADSRS